MQVERALTVVPAFASDEQLSTIAAMSTAMTEPRAPHNSQQNMIILPINNQNRQNVTASCPLPCSMKKNCQDCIESQCMSVNYA